MTPYYNFEDDLKFGEEAEDRLIEKLYLLLPRTWLIEKKNDKKFDLKIMDGIIVKALVELKNDFMAEDTGNAAIEIECRGKLSGINVTKAAWWCHLIKETPYFIRTNELKEFAYRRGRLVNGGDQGSNTKMLLLNTESLIEKCKSIEDFVDFLTEKRKIL